MKQFIHRILMFFGLIAGLAASASAYEPMLVEGRIWEHTERYGYEPRELYSLEIGEASEKYGKMYSPVIRLESGDTIAFLREEPGKVFMLMGRSGSIIDVYSRDMIGSYTPDQETPVYDFTKNIGDSICLLNNPWIYDSDTMETLQGKLILKEKSTETISGIERISQKWEPSESGEAQTAIEGIGTLDHLLPFYDPRPLCCDFWTVSYGLYRVYDKDGTVIYGERFPEKKMLADGREWQYVSADSVITMRIDGTTTVDGKVYHILRTSDVPDETTLLRENRGRVYRLDSDGETKMYDFSLSIGFFFRSKGVDADNENTKVSVVIKESGESANENMDGIVQKWEIYLHEYTIIQACERLGILYGGTLRDGPIAGSGIVLSKVKDADGTILYDKNMGVSAVKTEQTGDGRMYDLMGREIREPQRGTVYIQDGRKKVQR